jgi:sulfur carrier protein
MRIVCNGEAHEISEYTLTEVLAAFGFKDAIVATALNGEFVPVGSRAGVQLKDGDRLEVLAPMQGG